MSAYDVMKKHKASSVYEYAMRFPDGTYYTGNNVEPKGERHQAYLYSELGAYLRRDIIKGFEDCVVERVL
jgi:hypothetical protein